MLNRQGFITAILLIVCILNVIFGLLLVILMVIEETYDVWAIIVRTLKVIIMVIGIQGERLPIAIPSVA